MQADRVLEKELLHVGSKAIGREWSQCHTGGSSSRRDLKAHPHRDTLLPNQTIATPNKPHVL